MSVLDHLKSALTLTAITLNLAFWLCGLVPAALLKAILPGLRESVDRFMDAVYRRAVAFDDLWLHHVSGARWSVSAFEADPDEVMIVLANHASWADILLLQSAIARKGPLLKFLSKRELIWIPILGLIFWAFDFPLLRREARAGEDEAARRRADQEAIRNACAVLKGRSAALMNFAEGTRFTPEKREAQKSPYEHLLTPRVGGLSLLREALDDDLSGVLDVTIVTRDRLSLWAFFAGRVGEVAVEVERIPAEDLPRERTELAAWLQGRWARKEARLAAARIGASDVEGSAPEV